MKELLLCALMRSNRGLTSGDVLDMAGWLAMDAGWPTSAYAGMTVQKCSALLKSLETDGSVRKLGVEKVKGVDRPVWIISGSADHDYPIPPPPEPKKGQHVIDDMDKDQLMAAYDAMSDSLATLVRQSVETRDLMQRQGEEFAALAKRITRQLAEKGLPL